MSRLRVWLGFGAALAAVALPSSATAQGFGVYEHSACVMGRAGTAVADPCLDGSSMFFNPAGIALLENKVANLGVTLIRPKGGFTSQFTLEESKLNARTLPVPTAFVAIPFKERWAAGIGVFAPYGLETDWPEDSQGRFLGYKSEIRGIYVQPTVAYKVNDWLSFGAGLDISFVAVELRQHLDLSEQATTTPGIGFSDLGIPNRTDFADTKLAGSGTGYGFNVGAWIKADEWISFGIRYLSRQKITLDGGTVEISQIATGLTLAPNNPLGLPGGTPVDALVAPQFAPGAPLSDQGASTTLRFPDQLVLGTAVKLMDNLTVLFDYQWTNWKVFESVPITFERLPDVTLVEDFEATSGIRFGGEYDINPVTQIRAGYLWHEGAAPAQTVTPNLPEGARSEFTLGFGTRISGGFRFDIAYQYIKQKDRRGRSTDGGVEAPTAGVNDGLYTFTANLFGLSLVYAF